MSRKLKTVEAMPDTQAAEQLLGLPAMEVLDNGIDQIDDSEATITLNGH